VAAWLSGSALVSISEVTLRRPRLVLGWVTADGRVNHLGLASSSGQLSLLPSVGRKMSTGQSAMTVCGWGVKAGMVHFTCGACGWQIKRCGSSLTRAISKCFRDEFLMIKRYTNLRLLTLLYYNLVRCFAPVLITVTSGSVFFCATVYLYRLCFYL